MKLMWFIGFFVTVAGRSDKFCDREPIRSTGFLASLVTRFTETDDLPVAPSNLDFAFIIVRRGMVVPASTGSKTYPKDWYYKTKWEPGTLTTAARRLMHKLGRSLYTRYRYLINQWQDDKVFVSSSGDRNSEACGLELVKGLFGSMTSSPALPKQVRSDYLFDKSFLFKKKDSCTEYSKLRKLVEKKWTGSQTKHRENFYKYLREKTGEESNQISDWYINSPEKVYWLWELLDFERKSRHLGPIWYDWSMRLQIYNVVKEYYNDIMESYWPMAIYLVGRMFQEMLDGFYVHNRQVHIHVTEDRTFAAFKGILLSTPPRPPEFGETLIVEVDGDLNTRVHSYRPYHSLFKDLFFDGLKSSENIHDLDDRIQKRLCLPMFPIHWIQRCEKSEFILNLPSYFVTDEGCGPSWKEYRRKKIEENKRKKEAERKRAFQRAFSGGELPEPTSFSSSRYPGAEYQTVLSRKDRNSPGLDRAYSDGDLPKSTSFSSSRFQEAQYQTVHGAKDIRSPALERALSHELPVASGLQSSNSPGRFDVHHSSSIGRTEYGDRQGSAGSTTSQQQSWRPISPFVP